MDKASAIDERYELPQTGYIRVPDPGLREFRLSALGMLRIVLIIASRHKNAHRLAGVCCQSMGILLAALGPSKAWGNVVCSNLGNTCRGPFVL
jgi:hypothetical protein